ncbi:unnamed protein product [Acanthoscelides obtectus]|uniref:DDE-1 domain-containing protein n=1 Tax=Acanthoscelides obtectus TaxID=200917 RepID=A0A9P0M4L5_ACAOB|nr:unnamed protein product [Acanthoscelides obtectus]CAK1631807.1 hypothetical protein AOBTE_LOCUS7174 [Acanthoscelides obtectus]
MTKENPESSRLGRKPVFSPEIDAQLGVRAYTCQPVLWFDAHTTSSAFRYAKEYDIKEDVPSPTKNGPIAALYASSKNGWINSELFVEWSKHIEKNVNPTENDTVLLVLDNHSSHISIEAYLFCRIKFIHMVSFPPHTSDHLQPLDLTFFGPLNNQLSIEYDLQFTNTGHERISEYDLAELLNRAFSKVATMKKAISGFRIAGIYPLNPDKFTEEDFAPANQIRPLIIEVSIPDTVSDIERPSTPIAGPSTSRESPVNQYKAETSSESDISNAACDDDDEDEFDHFDDAERRDNLNEECGICGKFGRDRELWYRCVGCSTWNHAACSGADRAEGYLCDYCHW